MFANRIGQYFMDDSFTDDSHETDSSVVRPATGFAMLPAFVRAPAESSAQSSGPPDIYRVAYEQAREQVAARHERQRRAHEWN